MSETIDGRGLASLVAPTRRRRIESVRRSSELARALAQLVASKARLATQLEALFRASRGLPLRLALSDHRRETITQVDRLQLMIAMLADRDEPPSAPVSSGNVARAGAATRPSAAVVATMLRASQGVVSQYQAALTLAAESGLPSAVTLLTASLTDERAAVQRLSAIAVLIPGE